MQLIAQHSDSDRFTVQPMDGALDRLTIRRLHSLGIRAGSQITVIRRYPFHGPIIIQIDQQRVALRYPIFESLVGGA